MTPNYKAASPTSGMGVTSPSRSMPSGEKQGLSSLRPSKKTSHSSAFLCMEHVESLGYAMVEALICDAARCSWKDATLRTELLRNAYAKFNQLVSQILDVPEARKLLLKIRQGYRRTTTAKVPVECSRGRSLQSALARLEAIQASLAQWITNFGEKFFDARVYEVVQHANMETPSCEMNRGYVMQTVEFLVALLSFMGQLCIGSCRTAEMINRFVPKSVITALLSLTNSCEWHTTSYENSNSNNNDNNNETTNNNDDTGVSSCQGLGEKCRSVKQAVLRFLLRSCLQPRTGCCGRCPSGSGRAKGYAGLNVKWTCECGPSCFCFYRASFGNEQMVSTAPTSPAENKQVDFDELCLPASACILSRQLVAFNPLSRGNSFESTMNSSERDGGPGSGSYHKALPSAASTAPSEVNHQDDTQSPKCHSYGRTPLLEFTPHSSVYPQSEAPLSPYILTRSYNMCPPKDGYLQLDSNSPSTITALSDAKRKSIDTNMNDFKGFGCSIGSCVFEDGNVDDSPSHCPEGEKPKAQDCGALVGACISADLAHIAEKASDVTFQNDSRFPSYINYAMQVVAPCVVKCSPEEIGSSNVRSVQESLKKLQAAAPLPVAVKRSIQALILLVTLSLEPKCITRSLHEGERLTNDVGRGVRPLVKAAPARDHAEIFEAPSCTWYMDVPKLPPPM